MSYRPHNASYSDSRSSDGWSGSRMHAQNGHTSNGIGQKLEGFLDNRQLPMYKDKPYSYATSRRKPPMYRRWRVIVGAVLGFAAIFYLYGAFTPRAPRSQRKSKGSGGFGWLGRSDTVTVDWDERRERVKEAFMLSWDGYERYAWGYDVYYPMAKSGNQMAEKGMGWIIVDALDTLMIMNLTSRLSHAREWISTSLDYDQDQEVNTFETTIRMLGGLLSAHYMSNTYPDLAPIADDDKGAAGEDLYLEKAADLADRLLGAFNSESGVPYASVNLKTSEGIPSHADGGASSTAEAASLQLEMKYLAKLTGESNYWDKAEKVMQVIDDNGMEDGLLPIFIYASQGTFRGSNIRLGSRGDSYYGKSPLNVSRKYLIKQYFQTSEQEPIYLDMWNQALAGVRKHLITYSKNFNFTVLAERPNGLSSALSPKMDHLVCFMPGTIALGATGGLTVEEAKKSGKWGEKQDSEIQLAAELTKTCWGMYKKMATGLAAEITFFEVNEPPHMESDGVRKSAEITNVEDAGWKSDYVVKSMDSHNLQRPETVESLFYMWRITGEEKYREWGWEMFKSFVKWTAAEDGAGFTSLADANEIPPVWKDNMESFWLAETLKYFYLLFSPNELLPLKSIVINTEAHIFPRFELTKTLKTGWERKPRDSSGKIIDGKKKDTQKHEHEGSSESVTQSEESTRVRTVKVEETKKDAT